MSCLTFLRQIMNIAEYFLQEWNGNNSCSNKYCLSLRFTSEIMHVGLFHERVNNMILLSVRLHQLTWFDVFFWSVFSLGHFWYTDLKMKLSKTETLNLLLYVHSIIHNIHTYVHKHSFVKSFSRSCVPVDAQVWYYKSTHYLASAN